jgi:hypothetical protein
MPFDDFYFLMVALGRRTSDDTQDRREKKMNGGVG